MHAGVSKLRKLELATDIGYLEKVILGADCRKI